VISRCGIPAPACNISVISPDLDSSYISPYFINICTQKEYESPMSLFFAICDDEKNINAELESHLMDILSKRNIKHEIDVYYSGEELCAKMATGAIYNLIFLDIEFAQNAINGVEVGRLIREAHRNNAVSIVYMSWKMQYSMQLFAIRPLDFLIKPLAYEQIEKIITTYLDIHGLWIKDFTYNIGHDIYKVQIKDIVYIQSDKRKLILHLSDGRKEEFYGSIKDIYKEQLQKFDFLYIHNSYIVNYDYIAAIKFDKLTLTTDATQLPISQRKRSEIRAAYCEIMDRRAM